MNEDRIDAELTRAAAAPAPVPPRLFVAIVPPPTVVAQLAAVADALARRAQAAGVPVRWLPPADYHLTLRFIGPCHPELVGALGDAVAEAVAEVPPFEFVPGGLGAFPSADRARVVWVGLARGADLVERLAAAVDGAATRLGLPTEARPLVPHITLGRLAQERSIGDLLASAQAFSGVSVQSVAILDSTTKSASSNYRAVRISGLSGSEKRTERQSPPLEPTTYTAPNLDAETDDGWPRGQGP